MFSSGATGGGGGGNPRASVSGTPRAGGSSKGGGNFSSVSRRFIADLTQLMDDLYTTHALFIRCVKPNTTLAPRLFI